MKQWNELNLRQRRFIDGYIDTGCAAEAARLAGYSKKTAGQAGHVMKKRLEAEIESRRRRREPGDIEDIGRFWAELVSDGSVGVRERLRASELLFRALERSAGDKEEKSGGVGWFKDDGGE